MDNMTLKRMKEIREYMASQPKAKTWRDRRGKDFYMMKRDKYGIARFIFEDKVK